MRGDWGGHCGSSRHHWRGFFISCVKIGFFFRFVETMQQRTSARRSWWTDGQLLSRRKGESPPKKGFFATDPDSELLACNAQNLFTHLGEETLPPPCQDWLERLQIIFGIIYFFETIIPGKPLWGGGKFTAGGESQSCETQKTPSWSCQSWSPQVIPTKYLLNEGKRHPIFYIDRRSCKMNF